MASTPIGSMADPADGGVAGVETTGTAESSAVPTSRSVFFFTTLFAFRPDAQDYTKTQRGSCDIAVCRLSIFCLIFVTENSRNRHNEPIAGKRASTRAARGRACRGRGGSYWGKRRLAASLALGEHFVVIGIATLEPRGLAVRLEREDVRRNAVEEPAVVAHHHHAAAKVL